MPEEIAIARQQQPKHASAATNQRATIDELLGMATWRDPLITTDTHLFEIAMTAKEVLHTTGTCQMRTLVCELHMGFQVPYIYN
jgi:hypothetical protein